MAYADKHAVRAFTSDKVVALTGLSKRQLQYWDEQNFVSPSVSNRRVGRGHRRLYGFRDLVALRVAAGLRQSGISLQMIRKVVAHLRELDYESPLAQIRFWVRDGTLYFAEAGTVREGKRPSQTTLEFVVPVGEIVRELDEQIQELETSRPVGKIERRRGVLGSKPVIAGTRIPVASIRRLHADGAPRAEIRETYPDLTDADIDAALEQEHEGRPASATG